MIDLGPATDRMSRLVAAIADEDLDRPTPSPGMGVGDLVDHVGGGALAFAAAARKEGGHATPPTPSALRLGVGWRERIPRDLALLAEAWRAPEAWEGMTAVGGIDLPGEVAALVALDELTVHGWDLAVATGLDFTPDPVAVDAALAWVTSFDPPRDGSLFGPAVPVPDDAPAFERLLGITGRDPHWKPPT